MAESVRCFLGVGTNLGDRVQNIIHAREQIERSDKCASLLCSSLYWTSPIGYLEQPAFINCVFEIETGATPHEILKLTQSIENDAGRLRDPNNQNAPRVIDIDILLYGDIELNDDKLIIPHPRMFDRRFVLEPLLELQPELNHRGTSVKGLFETRTHRGDYADQDVFRMGA